MLYRRLFFSPEIKFRNIAVPEALYFINIPFHYMKSFLYAPLFLHTAQIPNSTLINTIPYLCKDVRYSLLREAPELVNLRLP